MRMLRKLLLWTLILSLTATSLVVGSKHVSADTGSQAFTSVNDVRSAAGLPPLEYDAELEAKAVAWSQVMANNGVISHSKLTDGITSGWTTLGENVGMGPSVEVVVAALIASPHHYDNMVDPRFDHLGVGVFFDGVTYWVTQAFKQSKATPPVATPPPTTVSVPPRTTIPMPPPILIPEPTSTTVPETTTTTTTAAPPDPRKAAVEVIIKLAIKFFRWVASLASLFD